MTAGPAGEHQLLAVLRDAAAGRFPPTDGAVVFLPPLRPGLEAVVSFTGRAYLATALSRADFADLPLDAFGAALAPSVLLRLAGTGGDLSMVDLTLVASGCGSAERELPLRTDLDAHPRVRHARAVREHVRVHGDERGLVTLAGGLAGRMEMSVEANPGQQKGAGRSLIRDALGLVAKAEPVFAAVSPGNARSMRAFLAVGFQPIGSEAVMRVVRPVLG